MAKTSSLRVQPRDRHLLYALSLTPLTLEQAVRFSRTWPLPFSYESVKRRTRLLCLNRQLRRFRYSIATRGTSPNYCKLSRTGFETLSRNPSAKPLTPYVVSSVNPNWHQHTYLQTEFLIHLFNAAHRYGLLIDNCFPENTLRFDVDGQFVQPDFSWRIRTASGHAFSYWLEFDNCSEPIRSAACSDSFEQKFRRYEAWRMSRGTHDRLIFVTTGGDERAREMAGTASEITFDRRSELCYVTTLTRFLQSPRPLTNRVFLNHRQERVALIPRYHPRARFPVYLPPEVLAPTLEPVYAAPPAV